VRGQQHHRHARIDRSYLLENLHAVDVRHREIGHDEIGASRFESGETGRSAGGSLDREARIGEDRLQREANRGVVVDGQHSRHLV
jgi:hypothetical protein